MNKLDNKKSRKMGFRKFSRQKLDRIWLFGFHAVKAALNNKERTLFRLLATKNALNKLGNITKFPNLPTTILKPSEFLKFLDEKSVHQGLALEAKPLERGSLNNLTVKKDQGEPIIVLDRVKDPQNVGAIIRSAEVLGGCAVIGSTNHCAQETGGLVKAASGAFERIPYYAVTNISRSVETLKEKGYLIIGLDHSGPITLVDLLKDLKKQPIAFILGSEESGLRSLTKKKCEYLVKISTSQNLEVLNVSNAAAVTLFAAKEFL